MTAAGFGSVGPSAAGAGSGTSPLTWSHTAARGDFIVAGVGVGAAADGPLTVTVTYGGVPMTPGLRWESGGASQSVGFVQVFTLAGAPAGASTISVAVAGGSFASIVGGSLGFTAGGPLGVVAHGDSSGATVSSGTVTLPGTDQNSQAAAFVVTGTSFTAFTAGTSRFARNFDGTTAAGNLAGVTLPGGGDITFSWTQGGPDFYAVIAVEVQGAPQPAPPPPLAPGRQSPGALGYQPFPVLLTSTVPTLPVAQPATLAASAVVQPVTVTVPALYIAGVAGGGTGYFTDQAGQPRLYAGDTPWGLPANAGRWNGGNWQADIDAYMASRAAQGFTVARVHVFGTTKTGAPADTGATWDGIAPYTGGGYAAANMVSAFWARIDYLLNSALAAGITVDMAIAFRWDWDTGVFLSGMTTAQATAFGTAIGARYAAQPNILWFFGDDYSGSPATAIFDAILAGLRAAGDTHLVSIEQFSSGTTSRIDLSNPAGGALAWASNAQYNLAYYYEPTYLAVELAYAETSPIPVIWGDGYYYGDGASLPLDNQLARNFTWWALSSGARGFNTGSDAIWQWPSGAPAAVTSEAWFASVAGAVRAVYEALPGWQNLLPDTASQLVTAGRGTRAAYSSGNYLANTDTYVSASITPDGSLAVIYLSHPTTITIDQTQLGSGYTATWVDPASGATSPATAGSTYNSTAKGSNSAGDADWLLVLQAPAGSGATATPGAVAATSAVPAPVVRQDQTAAATRFAATSAVPGVVVRQDQVAAATLRAATSAVPAPVVRQDQAPAAVIAARGATVQAATVTAGGSATAPAALAAATSAVPPAAVRQDAAAAPAAVAAGGAVPGVVVRQDQAPAAVLYPAAAAVPGVAVSGGAAAAAVTAAASGAVPAVTAHQDAAAAAVIRAATTAVPAVSVSAGGSAAAAPGAVAAVAAVPAPVVRQDQAPAPATVAAAAAVPAPVVRPGEGGGGGGAAAVSARPAVTASGGAGAAPGTVTALAGVPAAGVRTGSAVAVLTVAAAATVRGGTVTLVPTSSAVPGTAAGRPHGRWSAGFPRGRYSAGRPHA